MPDPVFNFFYHFKISSVCRERRNFLASIFEKRITNMSKPVLGGKIHITETTKNALLGLGGYEIAERGLVPIKVQYCMTLL